MNNLKSKTFCLAKDIKIVETDVCTILTHPDIGTQVKVSHDTGKLLKQFKSPHSIQEIEDKYCVKDIENIFQPLLLSSILVDCEQPEYLSSLPFTSIKKPETFFMAPFWEQVKTSTPNPCIYFLGIPYEGGIPDKRGTSHAPDELRKVSSEIPYSVSSKTQLPCGWLHHEKGILLEKVNIVDMGNISIPLPLRNHQAILQRASKVVGYISERKGFPVIIGGDHSITLWTLPAFKEKKISIIYFDAHEDTSPARWGIGDSHGNFMNKILETSFINKVYYLGLRGITSINKNLDIDKVCKITSYQLKKMETAKLLDLLPEDEIYYLSFDIDVLDPTVAPGTGTPVPDGLSVEKIQDILIAIGGNRNIIGMDLVEINPFYDRANITSYTARDLLLIFLDAIFKRYVKRGKNNYENTTD